MSFCKGFLLFFVNGKGVIDLMTVEVALVISGLSVAFGIWPGVSNVKRNEKNDTKADAQQVIFSGKEVTAFGK